MKKYITLFLIIIMLFSFASCNNTNYNNSNKSDNIQKSSTSSRKNKYEFPEVIPMYDIREDMITWDKVENADGYYVTINHELKIDTVLTYYKLNNYKPGYYTVTIEPYDKDNKYYSGGAIPTQIRVNGFEDEEAAKKKAREELTYSLVEIKIERYNVNAFGIHTDKKTENITGVICKKNGQTYWTITFSELLKSGVNYEKTKITVKDRYGNEYVGTKIKPTENNSNILSVISFVDSNTEKTLPVATFSNKIGEIEHVMLVTAKENLSPVITSFDEMERATHYGSRSNYQAAITKQEWNVTPDYKAVFDEYYNLVGIAIHPTADGKVQFLQIREVLEYINPILAQNYGVLEKTKVPVDLTPVG